MAPRQQWVDHLKVFSTFYNQHFINNKLNRIRAMTETNVSNKSLTMDKNTRRARNLTLYGYLGVVLLIPIWIWVLAPPELLSKTSTTILWWTPLLFPMIGILKNNPFTFAWSGFLAVFYLSQAITTFISSESEQYLALIEIILTSCWFIGASMFSRWRGQELGLELKKKNSTL